MKLEVDDGNYDTRSLDNSRVEDTTTTTLAELGLTIPPESIALHRTDPDQIGRKDSQLQGLGTIASAYQSASQSSTGDIFNCQRQFMFDQKMESNLIGELPRQIGTDFISMAANYTNHERSVQQTVQRVCFEEQMMRQLLKLVKQGELSECEQLLLAKEMENGETLDFDLIGTHLNTYHAVKQIPNKYDQSTCEQLIASFKESIEQTWQSMNEAERNDFSRSALDLDDDIYREEQKRKRKPRGPKRPSAYNLYLRDHKEIMRKDHPDWTPSEVNKRVGLDWKHASIDVKNEYKKKALDIAVGAVDSSPATDTITIN